MEKGVEGLKGFEGPLKFPLSDKLPNKTPFTLPLRPKFPLNGPP